MPSLSAGCSIPKRFISKVSSKGRRDKIVASDDKPGAARPSVCINEVLPPASRGLELVRSRCLFLNLRRFSHHGVGCNPAPTRGAGSSSRIWNTPPAVSTLEPTHHRETGPTPASGDFGSFGAEWRSLGFWFVGSTHPDRYANAKEAGRLNEIPTNIRVFLRSPIRPCRPASKR